MNIFVVDQNPVTAACGLCDSHVRKMTLESAQLLATALIKMGSLRAPPDLERGPREVYRKAVLRDYDADLKGDIDADLVSAYRPYNPNSKLVAWLCKAGANLSWLLDHAATLAREHQYRFGKNHASQSLIEWVSHSYTRLGIDLTSNAPKQWQMMTNSKDLRYGASSVVNEYREFYAKDKGIKKDILYYTRRQPPRWLVEHGIETVHVRHAVGDAFEIAPVCAPHASS